MNLYAYVGNDPVNGVDPSGLAACPPDESGCIDDPDTETGDDEQPPISEKQRTRDQHVVTARRKRELSDGTKLNHDQFTDEEQGFRVSDEGTFSHPMKTYCFICDDGTKGVAGDFDVAGLPDGESGGHTHTRSEKGDNPLPGPEDGRLARATGQTAYVISSRGVFAIEKTPVGFRVRVLSGTLTSKEKRQIRKQVGAWNKHKGGSGRKCKKRSC